MASATENGPVTRADVQASLTGEPLTQGYQPTLPNWALSTDASFLPQIYILRDLELMLTHPMVRSTYNYFCGGLAGAEIEGASDSTEIQQFGQEMCNRYWEHGMPLVQGGYEYGWLGLEPTYAEDKGGLAWTGLLPFSPLDVFLLTQGHTPVGMRVKNVPDKGNVDLWLASDGVPAKALWYAHQPRWNRFYGRSQLFGAWRPWRRLAWKDGAETVTDTGVYRFAYAGPIVKYPEEDLQISGASWPSTTADSQGKPRRFARDLARFIAEQYKSGAGVGMPSTKYPTEQGGGDKWGVELPKSTLNVAGLIEYVKYLQDQISYGIGVPPELLAASETGSGYSGRKLPLEAFLMQQQKIANAILKIFVEQIALPLVRWNFGASATFTAKVKNILQGTRQAATGATTAAPANDERPDQVPGPVSPKGAPTPPATFSLQGEARAEVVRRIAGRIRRAA